MDHPALHPTDDHATFEPAAPTGVDWDEFFRELGQGTQSGKSVSREVTPPQIEMRVLCNDENGDGCSLVRHTDIQRVPARHMPFLPSGGPVRNADTSEFLIHSAVAPEKQELLRLFGSILQDPEGSA